MRLCRRLSWKLKGKLSRNINKIFVFLIVIATIVLGEWYIRPWEGGNRLIKGFFLLAFAVSLEPIFLMDTMRKCSLDLASTWPISVILRILERIAGWLLNILSVPLEAIWRVIRTIGLVVSFVPRMIYKFCKFIKKCADRRKSRRMQEEYAQYGYDDDDRESYDHSADTDDEERYSESEDDEDADDRYTYRESQSSNSQRSYSSNQSSNSQRNYSNNQSTNNQRSYSNSQSSNSQKTQSDSSNTNGQKTYGEGNNTNHQQTNHGSSTKSAYQIKYENALRMFGVRTPFTADQLHRRWRELMKSNHPDAGGSTAKAAQINENYQMLLKYASGK